MDAFLSNIRNRFRNGDILFRIIYVNIALFLLLRLVDVFLMLFKLDASYYMHYLEFPSSFQEFLYQPWSVVTYMFAHYDFLHILFNMLWLYWFGRLFLEHFDQRKLFGTYLSGGIFGAFMFMIAYNLFPYYSEAATSSYLLGASASVMAIVFGVSFYAKEEEVALLFIGRIKIYYLAIFTLLLDLLSITSGNAGGHLAHIGGALFGILFATQMRAGKDVTSLLNKLIDKITNLFSRKPKMKVTYQRPETDYDYNARKQKEMQTIDAILDKLKRSGYQSLSSEEKKQLFDASKK